MRGLLLTGGEGPSRIMLEPFLEKVRYTVAADSGLDLAVRLGVEPDLIVGDMDSLRDVRALGDYDPSKVVRYPRDKDETDTEIGLRVLFEHEMNDVVIAGGGGGRLAHLIGMLTLFHREPCPRTWLTAREHIEYVSGSISVSGCSGQVVSFFPVEKATVRRSTGLKWPLDGLSWGARDAGISNEAEQDTIHVEVSQGALLMVREWS